MYIKWMETHALMRKTRLTCGGEVGSGARESPLQKRRINHGRCACFPYGNGDGPLAARSWMAREAKLTPPGSAATVPVRTRCSSAFDGWN